MLFTKLLKPKVMNRFEALLGREAACRRFGLASEAALSGREMRGLATERASWGS